MSVYKVNLTKKDGTAKTKEELRRETGNENKLWCFYVRYTNAVGEIKPKRSTGFETKKKAEEAKKTFLFKYDFSTSAGIKAGNLIINDMTLDDLAEEYFKDYTSDKGNKVQSLSKVKSRYYYNISPYLGKYKVTKITKKLYKDFKVIIDKKTYSKENRLYKLGNKNTIHGLVVSILNYGMQEYDLTFNVAQTVGRFKKNNTWNEEEELESMTIDFFWDLDIFNKFINEVNDIMYKTWFIVLFYLGLRRGESLALRWKDALIIIQTKKLRIYKNLTQYVDGEEYIIDSPKTEASKRELDVPDIVIDYLTKLYEDKKEMHGFNLSWFIFGDESPIPKTTADRKKDNYMDLAEVTRITFHALRHSFCSYLLTHSDGKINIYDVSGFLGHSSIETTQKIYAHVLASDKNKIANFWNDKVANINNFHKND